MQVLFAFSNHLCYNIGNVTRCFDFIRRFPMIHAIHYDCAATYLYKAPEGAKNAEPKKVTRKVEAVSSVYTGKRFNPNSAARASHNHIDICI